VRGSGSGAEASTDAPATGLPSRGRDIAVRLLLARRLMRDGDYATAYRYFGSEITADDTNMPLGVLAKQYATARDRAQRRWTKVGRAEATFEAASLARRYGMELLGFELDPDMAVFGGSLGVGFGPTLATGDAYAGPDETARVDRSTKAALRRFHYRSTAEDLASQAADSLPHRSQAFAAVLCTAAGWTRDGPEADHSRELQFYDRYRREGPHVRWATNFGRHCQSPDFGRAMRQAQWDQWRTFKHFVRQCKLSLFGISVLAGALLAWWIMKRRRRAPAAAP